METPTFKTGESITIGLWFNNNYILPDTCNMIVYIGGVCIGNLMTQKPEITRDGIYYKIKLSSRETSLMRGYRDIILVLDDFELFGNKKNIIGGILFERLQDEYISDSENNGYNMFICITIEEKIVSGCTELVTKIKGIPGPKGDKGEPGRDGKDGLSGTTDHTLLINKNSETDVQHLTSAQVADLHKLQVGDGITITGAGSIEDPFVANYGEINTTQQFVVSKIGRTNTVLSAEYPIDKERTITGYRLSSTVSDFECVINGVTYTKADITDVVILVGQSITINDITINAGEESGSIVLILE